MPFYAKLALLTTALTLAAWWLVRHPEHPLSRLAFSWRGPAPRHNERLSEFTARRALFSLQCFAQVLVPFLGLWLAVLWKAELGDTVLFRLFWFALPLLGGIFLLAASLYGLSSAKQRWLGPDPVFGPLEEEP